MQLSLVSFQTPQQKEMKKINNQPSFKGVVALKNTESKIGYDLVKEAAATRQRGDTLIYWFRNLNQKYETALIQACKDKGVEHQAFNDQHNEGSFQMYVDKGFYDLN